MIHINGSTREQLLSLPVRDRPLTSENLYESVLLIPSMEKSITGYGLNTIIGCNNGQPIEIASRYVDILHLHPTFYVQIDCCYPSGAMHVWSACGTCSFKVGRCGFSMEVYMVPRPKKEKK